MLLTVLLVRSCLSTYQVAYFTEIVCPRLFRSPHLSGLTSVGQIFRLAHQSTLNVDLVSRYGRTFTTIWKYISLVMLYTWAILPKKFKSTSGLRMFSFLSSYKPVRVVEIIDTTLTTKGNRSHLQMVSGMHFLHTGKYSCATTKIIIITIYVWCQHVYYYYYSNAFDRSIPCLSRYETFIRQ